MKKLLLSFLIAGALFAIPSKVMAADLTVAPVLAPEAILTPSDVVIPTLPMPVPVEQPPVADTPVVPVAPVPQQTMPVTVTPTMCASQANAAALAQSTPDFVYVSISDQMAYMYRNSILVASGPCVTGNASRHYDTTVGYHRITFMDTNRTLRGSYGTAFVKYWMRFTAGGQGLHDAGWRSEFGGQIYKTSGSHGCVNLQRPVAQTMYSYAYVGMPVIVVP